MTTKETYIKVYVPPKMKQMLEKKALQYGWSTSSFVRYLVVKNLEESNQNSKIAFYVFDNFEEIYNKLRKINLLKASRRRGS